MCLIQQILLFFRSRQTVHLWEKLLSNISSRCGERCIICRCNVSIFRFSIYLKLFLAELTAGKSNKKVERIFYELTFQLCNFLITLMLERCLCLKFIIKFISPCNRWVLQRKTVRCTDSLLKMYIRSTHLKH